MKTKYIQFQVPKNVRQPEIESPLKGFIKKIAINFLKKIIPIANPDFENKFDEIEYWLLEFDEESGKPQREIGLNKNGQMIMKMPLNDNYGYWIDNNLLLNDFKLHFKVSDISKENFEQHWTSNLH